MSLHDEHLKQALQHAPDRDIAPAVSTRQAVFNYAHHSTQPQRRPFYAGIIQYWQNLHIAHWGLASAGSMLAAVLVLVVFWNQKDSEWVDATPADIASVERGTASVVAGADVSEALNVEKPTVVKKQTEVQRNRDEVTTLEKHTPEKKEAAAGMTQAAAPESKSVGEIVADVAPMAYPELDASQPAAPLAKENAAVPNDAFSKRKLLSTEPVARSGNANLADAVVKEGGLVVANRDIQAGLLRNLYVEAYVSQQSEQACTVTQPDVPETDRVTGYRVTFISGCYATAALIKEVEIYNQTMYAWHAKSGK